MGFAFKKAHRDDNHLEVVGALQSAGAVVVDLASVGGGVPDLVVFYNGSIRAVEIKNPDGLNGKVRRGAADSLTDAQIEMFARIGKTGCRVHVVTSAAEALAAIGAVSYPPTVEKVEEPS